MEKHEKDASIKAILGSINQRPGRMIQLASLLYAQSADPIGFGIPLTTAESGLLFFISNNPGITNTILAKQFGRTKGAISQIIKNLEKDGYILKERNPRDAKSYNLYTSLEGNKIMQAINEYDMNNENSMLQKLLQHCSVNDIQTFFRMVDIYSALLVESIENGNGTL